MKTEGTLLLTPEQNAGLCFLEKIGSTTRSPSAGTSSDGDFADGQ